MQPNFTPSPNIFSNTPPEPPEQPAAANETPAPSPDYTQPSGYQTQTSQPTYTAPLTTNPLVDLQQTDKEKRRKRLRIIVVTAVALILLGSGGFVFGYYLPNTPENVWKTGMERTNLALDRTTETLTSKTQREVFKKSEFTLDADVNFGSDRYEATLTGKTSEQNSDYSLVLTPPDATGPNKPTIELLRRHDQKNTYPDLFLKVSNLGALGLIDIYPNLAQYENRWMHLSAAYIEKQVADNFETEDKKVEEITEQEIMDLLRTAQDTASEYLLTTDPEKAILTQKSFIGKEESYGRNAYRYDVGANQENMKKFCGVLAERMTAHPAYKKLPGLDSAKLDEEKKEIQEECNDSSKQFVEFLEQDGTTANLWIDAQTKLVHKIRFQDNDGYGEFGQNYSGGDTIKWFVKTGSNDKKDTMSFTAATNSKTQTIRMVADIATDSDSSPIKAKFTMDIKPFDGEINGNGPLQSTPIEQILEEIETAFGQLPNTLEDDTALFDEEMLIEQDGETTVLIQQ